MEVTKEFFEKLDAFVDQYGGMSYFINVFILIINLFLSTLGG